MVNEFIPAIPPLLGRTSKQLRQSGFESYPLLVLYILFSLESQFLI